MKKLTQKQRVINQLKEVGFVSRNWCLSQRITRLAALAALLRSEGWELQGEDRDGDYCYVMQKEPVKMVSRVVEKEGKYYEVRVPLTAN